ncbi:type II toxin-antitoxin system VapB family antitoxin [Brooklawnia cerclae]|uniref:Antitoxin VapB n=1 Tax=Brooklawnia cerclae TaxID=349934 RepID=A0ABX0SHG5_9ACTN|nr:type II toxin-antitoxin system VapB family antitoxin [Brooklawnia cerclae]NIH56768.1 antitoxin VapB [Brooklawnia cerclae]
MALSIKDAEADRLVRELAAATGETITEAARKAFAERLQRVRSRVAEPDARAEIDDIIARGRSRAMLDERTPDEIIGYDDHGLPA